MNSGLEVVVKFPVGTPVTIDKVELHTGRVSGTTTAYLFGRIYNNENGEEYPFQYGWDTYHSLYQGKPYWTFGKAFWQTEALEEKFFIEVP